MTNVSKDDELLLRRAILKLGLRMSRNSTDHAAIGQHDTADENVFRDGVLHKWPIADVLNEMEKFECYDTTDVLYYEIICMLWVLLFPNLSEKSKKPTFPTVSKDDELLLRGEILKLGLQMNRDSTDYAAIGGYDPADKKEFIAGVREKWPIADVLNEMEKFDGYDTSDVLYYQIIRKCWRLLFPNMSEKWKKWDSDHGLNDYLEKLVQENSEKKKI